MAGVYRSVVHSREAGPAFILLALVMPWLARAVLFVRTARKSNRPCFMPLVQVQ